MHGEPVLVDEARADQAVGELPAAEGDDLLAGSRFSRGISCSTGPSVARAAFRSTSEPPWAKTTLGSAFKIRAIGLSELNQAGAISS